MIASTEMIKEMKNLLSLHLHENDRALYARVTNEELFELALGITAVLEKHFEKIRADRVKTLCFPLPAYATDKLRKRQYRKAIKKILGGENDETSASA